MHQRFLLFFVLIFIGCDGKTETLINSYKLGFVSVIKEPPVRVPVKKISKLATALEMYGQEDYPLLLSCPNSRETLIETCFFQDIMAALTEKDIYDDELETNDNVVRHRYRKSIKVDACKMNPEKLKDLLKGNKYRDLSVDVCENTKILESPVLSDPVLKNLALLKFKYNKKTISELEKFAKGRKLNLYVGVDYEKSDMEHALEKIIRVNGVTGIRFYMAKPFRRKLRLTNEEKSTIRYIQVFPYSGGQYETVKLEPVFEFLKQFPSLVHADFEFAGYHNYRSDSSFEGKSSLRIESLRSVLLHNYVSYEGKTFEKVMDPQKSIYWESKNLSEFEGIEEPNTRFLSILRGDIKKLSKRIKKFRNLIYLEVFDLKGDFSEFLLNVSELPRLIALKIHADNLNENEMKAINKLKNLKFLEMRIGWRYQNMAAYKIEIFGLKKLQNLKMVLGNSKVVVNFGKDIPIENLEIRKMRIEPIFARVNGIKNLQKLEYFWFEGDEIKYDGSSEKPLFLKNRFKTFD